MSLQTTLENLRAKPDHIRTRIAFWGSFGVTAVIFTFWLGSFSLSGTRAPATVASAVDRAGAPAQSLLAAAGDLFTDLKDIFFAPKKIEYAEVEVRPGK